MTSELLLASVKIFRIGYTSLSSNHFIEGGLLSQADRLAFIDKSLNRNSNRVFQAAKCGGGWVGGRKNIKSCAEAELIFLDQGSPRPTSKRLFDSNHLNKASSSSEGLSRYFRPLLPQCLHMEMKHINSAVPQRDLSLLNNGRFERWRLQFNPRF